MSNYKFLIVMTTIYNTKIFRMSLRDLAKSIEPQDQIILIEDGLHPEDACREYASQFDQVDYLKFNQHESLTDMIGRGICTHPWQEYDYVVVLHNDVSYSRGWRTWLEGAIRVLREREWHQKCPLLNLMYQEYAYGNLDFDEDTDWCELASMLQPYKIYGTQITDKFGLGQDRWNMSRTGRTSPVLAIEKNFLVRRGGFCIDEIEYDLSMMYEASKNKLWNLWIEALGITHFRPAESGNDTVLKFQHGKGQTHYDFMEVTEKNFKARYGHDIESWFNKEFGQIKKKHQYEIERAFNDPSTDLAKLDFVFDEIWNDN